MTVAPRIQALAAIVVLVGLGLWVVLQITGAPTGVPEVPGTESGPGDPELERVPIVAPGTAMDLEVAIEVQARARILSATPSPEVEILRLAGDRVSDVSVLTRPRGRALVELAMSDGGHLYRVVDLDRPQPMIWPEIGLHGRVVDAMGAPVRGAEVWYGQAVAGVLQTVTTDADGGFSVPSLVGGNGIPVMAWAPGRVRQYQVLSLDGSAYSEPLFVLEAGTTVTVGIAAETGTDAARIFLVPLEEGSTDLQQFPFFLGALASGWEIGVDGRVSIEGLPGRSRVGAIVHHPMAVTGEPHPIGRNGAGGTVPLVRQEAWTGRVVDSKGLPVAGATVVSLDGARRPPEGGRYPQRWLLPAETELIGVAHDRTGDHGGFAVARNGLLRITAPGYAGLEIRSGDDDSGDIVLPDPEEGEPALRFLVPDCSGSYRIRCRPYVSEWRTLTCGTTYTVALPESSVVDVTVQIRRDGQVGEPILFHRLPVQGVTEVDLR